MKTRSFNRGGWREVQVLALVSGLLIVPWQLGAQPSSPGNAVRVVTPEKASLRRTVEQPGRIEAFEEAPIVGKIAGYVRKVHRDIGDKVQGPQFDTQGKLTMPGDLLLELAVPELEEEAKQKAALIHQAEAEEMQAQAGLKAAEAFVSTAQAAVREAEAGRARADANHKRWESEYARFEKLAANQIVDAQSRDEVLNRFRAAAAAKEEVESKVQSAKASLKESEAKQAKAAADVGAAAARIQVARAEERRVLAMLEYTKLRAPFEGRITRRGKHVNTGQFLQPSDGKTEPVFVVTSIATVRVFVDVPEAEAVWVKKGDKAAIQVQALKGLSFQGTVERNAWSLDERTRTLRTEIDLPNKDEKLRPGMYAYVSISVEQPAAFTLPLSAIGGQGDNSFCCRVANGKAIRTPIKLGGRDGQRVEVLKMQTKPPAKPGDPATWADFTGQEEIIADNPAGFTDGQAVTVSRTP